MNTISHDLFISYRSTDLAHAEALHERLSREGFRVWFDRSRLDPGCNWYAEIEAAAEASRIVLPVLTPAWQESEWCRFETYGAEHVIPLLFAGEFRQVTPPPLRALQSLDFRDPARQDWDGLLTQVRHYLSQPRPEKTARFASLPFGHNPYFVGREKLLLQLHDQLCQTPSAGLTQGGVLAVVGMGGVGKTTVVREYAEKFWRLYRNILWVRAEPDLIASEFARLAVELGVIAAPSQDANDDARRALRELSGRTRRLLILDNASDEESVQRWLPGAGGCHVLITSRFVGWSAAVPTVSVEVLEPGPARELLLKRSGVTDDATQRTAADRLASEMGYLPLGLEQAAAFARKVRLGLDRYLEVFARSRFELLAQRTPGATQYADSVGTTWRMTETRLGPLARALLRLSSFLAPENIPLDLLLEAADLLRTDEIDPTEMTLRFAVAELADFSMIAPRGEAFSVHRLVQAVQKAGMDEASRRQWAERATLAVQRVFPSGQFATWPDCERLLAHARTAAALIEEWSLHRAESAELLNRTAIYLRERAQYAEAEPLFRQALEIRKSVMSEKHPLFAQSLNNLAALYSAQGRYVAAEPLFAQAMEIYRNSFGARHPHYATSLNNLAAVYQSRGLYAKAQPLYQEAADVHASGGRDNPHYASSLNNLAVLHRYLGNYSQAESLFRQAVEMRRTALGHNHPEYARSLNNLADLYRIMSRFTEAEPLARQATDILREALGETHPHHAQSVNNLGALYAAMGDRARAEQLHRQALAVLRAAQGEGHPNVAQCLGSLALLLRASGDLAQAETLAKQALEIRRTALGEEHPHLASSLTVLAEVYQSQGRLAEAEPLYRQALEIRLETLGPDHPDLAQDMIHLADLYLSQNDVVRAKPLFQEGLTLLRASLGEEHPDVVELRQRCAPLVSS